MKNLNENYINYASFQIPLRIKISVLVKLLAYQNQPLYNRVLQCLKKHIQEAEAQYQIKQK